MHHRSFWRWAQRARVAASLLQDPEVGWVCDIGCGMQHLRWFLPRGAVYLPADLRPWTADTEICDLDRGELPVRSLALCDVAVLLGVIAYLKDPEQTLRAIAHFAEHVLISYRTVELTPERKPYWTNAYSLAELTGVLDRSGFAITELRMFKGQVIVRAANKLGLSVQQAERREAARSTYQNVRGRSLADAFRRTYFTARTRRALKMVAAAGGDR